MEVVYITGALMIGLIVFATGFKFYQVHKAASWSQTSGKVLSAKAVSRRVRTAETRSGAEKGGDEQLRNFAEIRYEYRVNGKRYTGQRVSIGEDLGDHDVAGTLQRYPQGSGVTVYYNPANPSEAVLERDAPEGVLRTMMIFVVVLVAIGVGGSIGFDKLVATLQASMRDPARAVPVAACLGFAAFLILMGVALRRQVRDVQAWPTTVGRIESARVDQFMSLERIPGQSESDSFISMRWQRLFRPDVVYRYSVASVTYRSTRIGPGGRVYATFDSFARQRIRPYREGDTVTVHYDPTNPAQAFLETRAHGGWVPWALAALFLVAAGTIALR